MYLRVTYLKKYEKINFFASLRKESEPELDPDPNLLVRCTDLDPDPHQNVTVPQHWLLLFQLTKIIT
jgi:hypothetical protein